MDKLILWSAKYETGCPEVDKQHKGLFDLINMLYSNYKTGYSDDTLQIIDKLQNYAFVHFRTEEKLFEKYGFEYAKEHIAEHQKFIDKVQYFYYQYKHGLSSLEPEILLFLKEWIIHHIMNEDQKYRKQICQDNRQLS